MARDVNSVGLTDAGQERQDRIEELGWFKSGQDMARFAMAYAIRHGVEPGEPDTTPDTRWTFGLFDDTGEMRDLMAALYPEVDTPVRCINRFIDEGLRMIVERVAAGETDPATFL